MKEKLKEQEKTINLLTQRINLKDSQTTYGPSVTGSTENNISQNIGESQPINAAQIRDNSHTQYQAIDMRMKQMEMSMLQNMSVFTLCTAQLNMQIKTKKQSWTICINNKTTINIASHTINRASGLQPHSLYMYIQDYQQISSHQGWFQI